MRIITRITTLYDEAEDRLRLAVLDQHNWAFSLWVTQRLANRIVAALTDWLARHEARTTPSFPPESEAHLNPPSAYVEPVLVGEETERVLVLSIDLTRTSEHYSLLFRWHEGEARLVLQTTELRQWLGILHSLYRQAQWPETSWPPWSTPPTTRVGALVFH